MLLCEKVINIIHTFLLELLGERVENGMEIVVATKPYARLLVISRTDTRIVVRIEAWLARLHLLVQPMHVGVDLCGYFGNGRLRSRLSFSHLRGLWTILRSLPSQHVV